MLTTFVFSILFVPTSLAVFATLALGAVFVFAFASTVLTEPSLGFGIGFTVAAASTGFPSVVFCVAVVTDDGPARLCTVPGGGGSIVKTSCASKK